MRSTEIFCFTDEELHVLNRPSISIILTNNWIEIYKSTEIFCYTDEELHVLNRPSISIILTNNWIEIYKMKVSIRLKIRCRGVRTLLASNKQLPETGAIIAPKRLVGWLVDLILNVPVNNLIFHSCWDGVTASWVLPVLFWGVNVPCSRTHPKEVNH